VVELWGLRLGERLLVATVMSPSAQAGVAARGNVNYKHMLEVWLDTLRDEYERESARSPLERCVLFGENRFLDNLVVVRFANVPIHREGIRRCSLQAEARLEQRTVEISHATARRIAVHLARSENELSGEGGVGKLHCRKRPGE